MSSATNNLNTIENSTSPLGLISEHDLAAALHKCLRSLRRYHNARTGPPRIRIGRNFYYKIDTVNEWLARREGYGDAQPVATRRRKSVPKTKRR